MTLDSTALGERVAQARQRAGLTQDDLARSTGLERSALAKIETGARRITALELARIAEAVGERLEWFIDESPPSIVSHRNIVDPDEPSPLIDRVVERVVRAVEFVTRHDTDLRATLSEIPIFDEPTTIAECEELAVQARELLGVPLDEPLHGLSSKLVNAGVLTFALKLERESADAASVLLRSGGVAVINGNLRTGRRRLSLAHEFGHVLIADEYTVDWRIDNSTSVGREQSIDRFARALLLPRNRLQDEWTALADASQRDAAVRTASYFRVDMATLARRLLDLGLIDSKQAGFIRTVRTRRADIVEHDLVVADELEPDELPREYEAAVLRLFTSETVSDVRALDLLLDTWSPDELPALAPRHESEIWQFVS